VLAIDTNLIVRLVVDDNPDQALRARRLIEANEVFVATTVLLETEWVLRRGYGLKAGAIAESFKALAGHPNVSLEDPLRVARALDGVAAGLDFADALHLFGSEGCSAFITFDRGLAVAAARLGFIDVRQP
jgi:predicted nucleic-acid-binding protein